LFPDPGLLLDPSSVYNLSYPLVLTAKDTSSPAIRECFHRQRATQERTVTASTSNNLNPAIDSEDAPFLRTDKQIALFALLEQRDKGVTRRAR